VRVVVIRHHEVDSAGFVGAAFSELGADVTTHLFPAEGPLPALDGVAHAVVLGSKWSVYDRAAVGRWIDGEFAWLQQADQAGVPVLGICFGAQALTAAFGGQVVPVGSPEIGWRLVRSVDPALIPAGPWLELHGDQCLPPSAARVLARNDVCVQAFSLGRHLAVQFHPEVDGAQLGRWLADGGSAAVAAAGTDPEAFLARTFAEEASARTRARQLVESALRIARGPGSRNGAQWTGRNQHGRSGRDPTQ
jgi:GMP synthase-like glutamine amidotransferase